MMDWQTVSLDRVIDEIVTVHHPRIRAAAALVECSLRDADDRWGGAGSAFERARRLFDTLQSDLDAHLSHEQATVFPALRALTTDTGRTAAATTDVLPLTLGMEGEHDAVRARLRQLRVACATCPVTPPAPEWAECARRVHGVSEALEALLMMENGVLYPRAIALDYARDGAGSSSQDRRIA
jgi:iron-sulfur cluster repair protein YtfE (RIC family)